MKCPVCNVGELPEPHGSLAETKKQMAVTLHKAGYSYRQISKFLNWKSPASVTHALTNTEPKKNHKCVHNHTQKEIEQFGCETSITAIGIIKSN